MASSGFPWQSQSGAEVDVGRGVVGLEPDRLAAFGDRLVGLPLRRQGDAEGVVGEALPGRIATAAVRCRTASSGSGIQLAADRRSRRRGAWASSKWTQKSPG